MFYACKYSYGRPYLPQNKENFGLSTHTHLSNQCQKAHITLWMKRGAQKLKHPSEATPRQSGSDNKESYRLFCKFSRKRLPCFTRKS